MREAIKNTSVRVGTFALFVALFIGLPIAVDRLEPRGGAPVVSGSDSGTFGDVNVSPEVSDAVDSGGMSAEPSDEFVECSPNYDPCVENSRSDLDCADIGFSVTVTGDDEYGLDRDNDGTGCESYR